MGSVAEVPINQLLGINYDENAKAVLLPDRDKVHNFFGQISFCAQFALAEAASAQYLFDQLELTLETDIPTLRNATTKFYKPASGGSSCNLVSLEHSREQFQEVLNSKRKILTSVKVEVVSAESDKALVANFQWLILRK